MNKFFVATFGALVAPCLVNIGHAAESAVARLLDVQVKLTLTSREYDPDRASNGRLTCSVVNQSTKPVEVFANYDARGNHLLGRPKRNGAPAVGEYWDLELRDRLALERSLKRSLPIGETVLFEFSLDEILRTGTNPETKTAPKSRWGWDWDAHPAPPLSPVHRWAIDPIKSGPRYVRQAEFWAVVTIDDMHIASNKVELNVKDSGARNSETETQWALHVSYRTDYNSPVRTIYFNENGRFERSESPQAPGSTFNGSGQVPVSELDELRQRIAERWPPKGLSDESPDFSEFRWVANGEIQRRWFAMPDLALLKSIEKLTESRVKDR